MTALQKNLIFILSALFVLAVAASIYFQPVVFSNEAAYLIPSRRLLDGSFLAYDWETLVRSGGAYTSILFDAIAVPFWAIFDTPQATALAFRTALDIGLVASIFLLVREFEVSPIYAAIGLAVWLLFGQDIAAGAWIVGGAEKKVLAYLFVLLSIVYSLRSQYLIGGLFAGLSVAAHVLVGCWGGLAIACALVVQQRGLVRDVVVFGVTAAVPAVPVMAFAIVFAQQGAGSGEPYMGMSTAELIVSKRNPHHGDPAEFLNFRQSVEALAFFTAAFFSIRIVLRDRVRLFMTAFAGVLVAYWLIGILARTLDLWGLLLLFPFRLGDVFIPLLVAILGIPAVIEGMRRILAETGWWPRMSMAAGVGAVTAAALLAVDVVLTKAPGYFARTVASWESDAESARAREQLAHWIREQTEPDSVFLVPPLDHGFKFDAERAVVASFKGAPGNAAIHEWFRRMEAMTGASPIERSGYDMIDWAEIAYDELSVQGIVAAGRKYCARYYLVERARPELQGALLVERGDWRLYDIARMDTHPSVAAGQLPAHCTPSD